jgi:pyruvate kinase
MHKRTKIITTVGPSTKSKTSILNLYKKGMNVVRINMSHASHEDLKEIIGYVKSLNRSLNQSIGIMVDTQGPEIRTAKTSDSLELKKGQELILTQKRLKKDKTLPVDNLKYVKGIKKGGKISLDNGAIELKIKKIDLSNNITCEVLDSGVIAGKKHVNFPGAKIKLPTLTDKDKKDLDFALEMGVDFIALSFCRSKQDLLTLKKFLKDRAENVETFVKVEDQEGLSNLDEIVKNSDGVMVARGDLGIETDITNLPYIQRKMIRVAAKHGKKSIVATQLLESMIKNPHPTRAEVSDVANAVYEGTDALMLSGETSVGKYPFKCVEYMRDIALNAERSETLQFQNGFKQETDWHTLAATTVKLSEKINADAIVVLTRSGFTANLISRARPKVPVYAFTNNPSTQSKLSLSSSVENLSLKFTKNHEKTILAAFDVLKSKMKLKGKKKFVVISGIFSEIYADAIQVRFMD